MEKPMEVKSHRRNARQRLCAVNADFLDIDPQRISLRHPVDIGLVGDAKNSLRALLPLLEKHHKRFLEKSSEIQGEMAEAHGRARDAAG